MKKKGYSALQRLGSFALAVLMVVGLLPITALADDAESSWPIGEVTTQADPDTVSRPVDVYGSNTKNAGKVTVGKSVSDGAVTLTYGNSSQTFTPGENNFVVTVSQTAQVMGLASQSPVPLDVVFILDTSGSMNQNGVNRASRMVTAANSAISTLMAANEHNRVAVVAFSSGGYGDGTSNDAAASVLSSLAHYTGDAATSHLQWVNSSGGTTGNSRQYIAGRDTVTVESDYWWQDDYEIVAHRHGYSGGTNIQAGIITGAKLLTAANNSPTVTTEDGVLTRMPFIIILSDGQPTYTYSDSTWYNPSSTSQQGDGNNAYAGNGFIPAVTAAYYKGLITEKYYGSAASESNRCSIYTIGVQLNEELAEITLNPRERFAQGANDYYQTFNSYWNSFNNVPQNGFTVSVGGNSNYRFTRNSVNAAINYVNGKSSTGSAMYDGGLAYNDDYFAATQTADIAKAFQDVVTSIQKKAISVPTKVDTAFGDDFSGYVTFTDPIGEYMEVKQVHGLLADGKWYRGASFAYHLQNWSSAPQAFKDQFTRTMQTRCLITGATLDMNSFVQKILASEKQAYYKSAADYDNSFVWWGNDIDSTADVDEHVQYLDVADNDTIAYIQANQATIEQLGADYVCRSYFFYGTAGDTSAAPSEEYLYFVIRVQRSLKAPYQQTVVVSAPASLLSAEKVMITESTDADGDVVYTASVTEAEPARVVYEVGLRSDINAFNVAQIMEQDPAYLSETAKFGENTVNTNYNAAEGTYTFYTNDWNRNASEADHERAMTRATFDAALDNDFYTYQEDTLIYVKNGESYVPYTGTDKPVGSGYYYARTVYDWSGAAKNEDGTYNATQKTEYIAVKLPNSDVIFAEDGQWYIAQGVYKASSLTGGEDVYKSENTTQTSGVVVHPHRTSTENDSHYTVYLGNNGKLTLKSQDTKSVSITKADSTVLNDADGKVVMVGEELTYTLDVVNLSDAAVTADVTDTVPKGTAYVPGSATHGGQLVDGKVVWNDVPVEAGKTVQVSFKVVVTEAALSGDLDVSTIDNQATVTLSNGFSYTTNTTKNPPEGKKVVDTNGATITGGVDVPDVLVYRIRWHNDSGAEATVTVTDIIPTGTSYVENSASHGGVYDAAKGTITWTINNVHAGASGVVSFRVNVNASAKEYISNDAEIKIGNNNPRQTNDTKVTVKTGSLIIGKTVTDDGFAAAATQTFTLNIVEIGAGMNGTYTMLRNGAAVNGGITFTDGVATATIRHGETIEIQGIPAGAIISVTEQAKTGFTPSYQVGQATSAAEGRVTINETAAVRVDVTNTYAPAAVTFEINATKKLIASDLEGNLIFGFTAQLCDANGTVITGTNAKLLTGEVTISGSEQKITFSPVVFSTTGVYHYLVSEVNGGVNGVTYSTDKYLLTVTVTDNGTGALRASSALKKYDAATGSFVDTTDTTIAFTNSYAPKETQKALKVSKVLTGRTLHGGEFSFVVKDSQGNVVSTGDNAADGTVTFRPITYSKADVYYYTISEVDGGMHGVTYSDAVYYVKVTVENQGGQLVATEAYYADDTYSTVVNGTPVFTNKFVPDDIEVHLQAQKQLVDKNNTVLSLTGRRFAFVVKDAQGNEITTGVSDDNGNVSFNAIGFTADDIGETFTYYITEVVPDLSADPFMEYTDKKVTVTVTISQVGTELQAVVKYDGLDTVPAFTNKLHPDYTIVVPSANKQTVDKNNDSSTVPTDATFSFTVINALTGVEAGVGVGKANGEVQFSGLTFTKEGTYLYWIKEAHTGPAHGITYDATDYLMKVEVAMQGYELVPAVTYYSLKEGGTKGDINSYTVELTGGAVPAFKNIYGATGSIAINAMKVLNGRDLRDGEFAFRLVRWENGAAVPGHEVAGLMDKDGNIQFATLYFEMVEEGLQNGVTTKIIEYRMTEVVPNATKLPGVDYDETEYAVYIKLTVVGNTIEATVVDANGEPLKDGQGNALDPKDSNVTFTNEYEVVEGTKVEINLQKELTGRDIKNGEYIFNLYHVDENGVEHLVDTVSAPATVVDANTGKAVAAVKFTRDYSPAVLNGATSREIRYVIREVDNHLAGVTYDCTVYAVTVTVADDTHGGLTTPVVTYTNLKEGDTIPTFRNTYMPAGTTYMPVASKVLQNREVVRGEFSFIIKDGNNNVVSTGTNNADLDGDGKYDDIRFSAIGYDTVGEHVYYVSEVKGNLNGVTYTTKVYTLVVKVVDNQQGQLIATGTYYDGIYSTPAETENLTPADGVFENRYTPAPISLRLEANKVLNGRDMSADEFSFVVEDLNGNVKATGGNAAANAGETAAVIFSGIGYKSEDLGGQNAAEFIYKIRELATSQGGVDFDDTVFYAKVTVIRDVQSGRLSASAKYYSNEACTEEYKVDTVAFTNTYDPADTTLVIYADKTLINKNLQAGEFTFTLKNDKGETVGTPVQNDANGTATFPAITYSAAGRYVYTVEEAVTDAAKAGLYTLDDSFTVIVTVVDDLKGNLVATATYHVNDKQGNFDETVNLGGAEFINRYTAPAITQDLSLAIGATKTVNAPNGITYSPAGFEFDVVDIKNKVFATGVSDANGNIQFTSFTFDKAGEYHYWVYEKDTNKGGISKDLRAWEIHILVRYSEQTGQLYIRNADVQTYLHGRAGAQTDKLAFVNEYTTAPAKLYLTATKRLEGRPLHDREFLFYLMDGNNIAAEAYNSADGTVKFELVYTQVGTHTYKIVEHKGSLGGVSYDTTAYTALTVEVRDDGNGQLVAYIGGQAMTNGATGKIITNTYSAKSAETIVLAHKHLLGGKTLKGNDFIFELKNKNDASEVYTVKNNADGHIEFKLTFDKAGEYIYTLREVKGSDPSITYDEKIYLVAVIVEDDAKGQLHAQVAYNTEDGHAPVFENTYKAQPVTAEIKAHKTLVGEKPLAAGQYFFELEGEGVKITNITNDASGNVLFQVKHDTVGEYTYTIRETKGTDLGTTYDGTEYKVKVVVTDDLNGKLVANVTYEGVEAGKVPSFTNSYKGEKVPVKVAASKILTDKKLVGDDFTFQLADKLDPTKVLTAKNDASGNVVFDLTFENSGVYVYTLSEVVGTDANITYDQNSYTVTITVTDDLKGYLTAKVEYATADGAAPVFKNAYTPNAIGITLEGTKKLTGRDLEAEEFSFQVRDSSGNLVATGKNAADGKIVFTQIKLPTAGKYTFTVTEVKGRNVSITYDETVFTVSVIVTNDNGTLKAEVTYPDAGIVFENIYEKLDPDNPDTGDHSGLAMYVAIMAVSLVGMAAVLLVVKKRSRTAR